MKIYSLVDFDHDQNTGILSQKASILGFQNYYDFDYPPIIQIINEYNGVKVTFINPELIYEQGKLKYIIYRPSLPTGKREVIVKVIYDL